LSITGNGYTTGWESLNLSVTECELTWNQGQADQHTTVLTCSNRRAHLSAASFLKPDRPIGGSIIPSENGWNPFGIFQPSFAGMYQIGQARQAQNAEAYDPSGGYAGFESTTDFARPRGQGLTASQYNREIDKLTGDYVPTQKEKQHAKRREAEQAKADERLNEAIGEATSQRPQTQKEQQRDRAYNEAIGEATSRGPEEARTAHTRDFERQARMFNPSQRAGQEPREPGQDFFSAPPLDANMTGQSAGQAPKEPAGKPGQMRTPTGEVVDDPQSAARLKRAQEMIKNQQDSGG
jgi:hypothetical protein